MFYRIFGGNGHGKTRYIFDRLSECVRNQKKAFLIVPEQSAVETEKAVIKKLGGKSNLYIEVINFKRLCNRVFRELGGLTSAHIDDGAKKMLMLLTLSEISPFLTEYSKSSENAEFAEKAISFVNEMKSGKVTPKMLEEAAERLDKKDEGTAVSSKLRDIALIAEAYDAKLSALPGACCDIYEKLCEKLKEGTFFSGCEVFFDSFYGFTAREYEIISLIAESCDNIYVTFVGSKDCGDAVFERSIKSAKMCEKISQNTGCELCDISLEENTRHKKDSALCIFERDFSTASLSGNVKAQGLDRSIESVVCGSIYDEAKFAACKILSLMNESVKPHEIVICAKNTSDYVGVIDTTFEKAKIPLGIDLPETLSDSALFELVVSAMEGASTFSGDSVIKYVKTGLSGLDEEEADLLETYVRTWNISPSLMKGEEDWTMNPDGYVDSPPDEYTLRVVNSARRKVLTCLDSLKHNLDSAKCVKDYCIAVFNLITDIKRVSSREVFYDGNGGISQGLLYECLDSFAGCAPDEQISLARFLSLFKSCAKNYDTGHIPARADEVRFSSVDLVRCEGVKYVFLLGVNSSVFPSSCTRAALITDSEREILKSEGIVLSESERELVFDELFLAYNVITSASEKCFVSCLSHDLSSEKLYPSVIMTAAERITGCERWVFDSTDFEKTFTADELLLEEMTAMPKGKKRNTLEKYFAENEQYSERLESLSHSIEQNDYLKRETADSLYGSRIMTSYSRLEKMAGCPFSHFCAYTLRLKPEPVAALGPAEAGSIMHKILEELVPVLCRVQDDGSYPDEERAKELVTEFLCGHLSSISHADVSKIPKRFIYLYNRLSRLLCEMAVNIVRELRVTAFKPSDFELNISSDADVKPVPIDLGDGCTLYIVGQIDRVDVYQKDGKSYIKIIDYKTGSKTFKMCDIQNGFNLQMLLYLASILSCGKEKYGENLVPAGVLYSNVVSKTLSRSLVLGSDDIDSKSGEVSKPVASGIFVNDEEILMAMDPTEDSMYIPIGRKNGVAKKAEALASLEEMGELLDFAMATAKELAKEMRKGLKSVTPFDARNSDCDINPCEYCDMLPVCMGDKKMSKQSK